MCLEATSVAIQIHYWSPDVDTQLAYYADVLSFEVVHRQPEESPTNFCILKLGDAQIMIAADPRELISAGRADRGLLEKIVPRMGKPGPISVYIGKGSLDAYYDQVTARGAQIAEPIWDAPWGSRQFTVVDPDGNLTTFFAE